MITSSRLHVPVLLREARSQSLRAGPPEALIFLSIVPTKNPSHLLSGDQKRLRAPSVFASGCAALASSGRTQMRFLPSGVEATNARLRPFGETATGPEFLPPKN